MNNRQNNDRPLTGKKEIDNIMADIRRAKETPDQGGTDPLSKGISLCKEWGKVAWDKTKHYGKIAGISLCIAFTLAAGVKPAWNYGLGVENPVCTVTRAQPRHFTRKPLWGWVPFVEMYDVDLNHDTPRDSKGADLDVEETIYVVHTKPAKGHEGDHCQTKYVQDTWWYGNTQESDLFGKLEDGATYRFKQVGLERNMITGYLGWAPNIVRAVKLAGPEAPAPHL